LADFNALLDGYRRFRETGWDKQRERWAELAEGQNPRVMVIACSDSRTDPAMVFDTAPGEIFTVRNIAALVPPFEVGGGRHGVSAALEFAVTILEVEDILVLGHGRCGGCQAALTQSFRDASPGEGGFIAHWIDMLDEARGRVTAQHGEADDRPALRAMEHEAVKVSLDNLRTFPFVSSRESAGRLKLRGGWFAIASGELHLLDEETGVFAPA
jgi:carbonic anhydrase